MARSGARRPSVDDDQEIRIEPVLAELSNHIESDEASEGIAGNYERPGDRQRSHGLYMLCGELFDVPWRTLARAMSGCFQADEPDVLTKAVAEFAQDGGRPWRAPQQRGRAGGSGRDLVDESAGLIGCVVAGRLDDP